VEAEAKKKKGLCITTRCKSLDEFIAKFHKFVDEDSFFIATRDTRPVGLETGFSIHLADKTPVLRGTCVVLQVWSNAANPFRLPGLRIRVKHLAASSIETFERLLVTRPEPKPPTPPSVVVDEAQLVEPEPLPPPPPPEPARWDSTPLLASSSTVEPEPRRRRMHIAIAGGALAIVAIAVPFVLAGSTNDDPPARAAATHLASPAPVPTPAVVEAPSAEPSCKISVASTPAGADVTLDGQPAGATPLELPASCERHKLDIAHARYAPATRWVTPAAGEPATVELALARPTHELHVTTTPPGASIVIDGQPAGTTPALLDVQGFTVHKLELARKGFRPKTVRYYSKVPDDHLTVPMAK
jgi:hypothetical protein